MVVVPEFERQYCCSSSAFWVDVAISAVLVLLAGALSGLTLGFMALTPLHLQVSLQSGTPSHRRHAAKILPFVKNRHLLLCTLLIGNALAMEALPMFLDELINAWGALLISVTLILMFGEILPKAVCWRYGLAVGAAMTPVVRLLVILFFPVAYPISKLLDFMFGRNGHDRSLLRRAELMTLVTLHGKEAGKGGELTHHETTIITGALTMSLKTTQDVMMPISATFSIDVNAILDRDMMNLIMMKGHSRIPVYSGSRNNLIGLLLVKNLLTTRPENNVPVRQHASLHEMPRVEASMPLYDILNEFQKGHSHMAAVVTKHRGKTLNDEKMAQSATDFNANSWTCDIDNILEINEQFMSRDGDEEIIGIITMEDVIEELLQEDILDEKDVQYKIW